MSGSWRVGRHYALPRRVRCPDCQEFPEGWTEKPKYGSRLLYWFGCRKDDLLAGGINVGAAVQNWNRAVEYRKLHNKGVKP